MAKSEHHRQAKMKWANPVACFLFFLVMLPTYVFAQGAACTVNVQQAPIQSTNSTNTWAPSSGANGQATQDTCGSTKLDPTKTVLIEAPEAPNANGTTPNLMCHSISNNRTDQAHLFVPWRSPEEWSHFLLAAPTQNVSIDMPPGTTTADICCPPTTAILCNDPNHPVQLGYRPLGTPLDASGNPLYPLLDANGLPTTDLVHWGAPGDVYGPLCSAIVTGNTASNYEVSYTCSRGVWTKTHEIGSCTPLNGACAISPGTSLATLPSDPQQLCGIGSILNNLVTLTSSTGATTGWNWECDGTPGMSNQLCNAVYSATGTNGVCGSDNLNSLPTLTATDANLCSSGTVAAFTGTGPWTWQCLGSSTGSTASCVANSTANSANIACGVDAESFGGSWSMAQLTADSTTNPLRLCSVGFFQAPLQGGGTNPQIFWWCVDNLSAPVVTVACDAFNAIVDGNCGSDSGVSYGSLTNGPGSKTPTAGAGQNLCSYPSTPSPSTPVYNAATQSWSWQCLSSSGGAPASCSASYNPTAVTGNCGTYSNGTFCTLPSPTGTTDPGYCSSGILDLSSIDAPGSWQYLWKCDGANGGSTITCSANDSCADGACGTASSNYGWGATYFATPPTTNLCSMGTASVVTGGSATAPWAWTCQGSVSGSPVASCYANYSGTSTASCGTVAASTTAPTTGLCLSGTASAVAVDPSSAAYWQWTCTDSKGAAITCLSVNAGSTTSSGANLCGSAIAMTVSLTAPTSNLCVTGSNATVPTSDSGNINWVWQCSDTAGNTSSCSVPQVTANGTCGASSGLGMPQIPTQNLCLSGSPTAVAGTGPWTWVCDGIGGGSNSKTCQANLCQTAAGASTQNQSINVSGTVGGCSVTALANWTEVDAISASGNLTTYSIAWTDSLGAHKIGGIVPNNVGICTPNNSVMQSVSGLIVTVKTSSCPTGPYSVGQVLPITVAPSVTTP